MKEYRHKINVRVPKDDFTGYENIEIPVLFKIPEVMSHSVEYSCKIPDKIFDLLKDTEERFSTKPLPHDQMGNTIMGLRREAALVTKFQKTQYSTSVSSLSEFIGGLTDYLIEKHNPNKTVYEKKIFITFSHEFAPVSDQYHGGYIGHRTSSNFRFFIGYKLEGMPTDLWESIKDPNKRVIKYRVKRYYNASDMNGNMSKFNAKNVGFDVDVDIELPIHGQSDDRPERIEGRYSILDWTQEREDFLKETQDKYNQLNGELAKFLDNMTDKKLDLMIENKSLKLLR